jgi:hypothetical protein
LAAAFTGFLAVAMMYLLFVLVLGLTPDGGLGRGSSDTAHFALRERQHSNADTLCKPRMNKMARFPRAGSVVSAL